MTPARRMLTAEEAADYCGFKSVDGFRAHIPVAPVRFGSQVVRYDVRDLDDYLDNLRNPGPRGGGGPAAKLRAAYAGESRGG